MEPSTGVRFVTVFGSPEFRGHQQVSFFNDEDTGLQAIIAIHRRGPQGSAGGIRMWPYTGEASAVRDVLRLSRAMSYKFALARIPLGGAKSVIIGDAAKAKTDALLEAFGRAVDVFARGIEP